MFSFSSKRINSTLFRLLLSHLLESLLRLTWYEKKERKKNEQTDKSNLKVFLNIIDNRLWMSFIHTKAVTHYLLVTNLQEKSCTELIACIKSTILTRHKKSFLLIFLTPTATIPFQHKLDRILLLHEATFSFCSICCI